MLVSSIERTARWHAIRRRLVPSLNDVAVIAVAAAGLWVLWSQYSWPSRLSRWYEITDRPRARTFQVKPDYDLTTLPWQIARSRIFEINQGALTVVTGSEPMAYQAYAAVRTNGAAVADLQFEADIQSGGVTIGLQQAGRWIDQGSSQRPGAFLDSISARLGFSRSVTVVIANDNPAGESRLRIKSLKLFLQK
jgi:hypothetical protein